MTDEVYSAEIQEELYTIYMKVPMEDVCDEFLTAEEYNEIPSSLKFRDWSNDGLYGVVNASACQELVGRMCEAYNNRKDGASTAGFKYKFGKGNAEEAVRDYVYVQLRKNGIRKLGDRLYSKDHQGYKPKKKLNTQRVRWALASAIGRYVIKTYSYPINPEYPNYQDNQICAVRFAAKGLKLKFDFIVKFLKENVDRIAYAETISEDETGEAEKYAKEFWTDVVKGKILTKSEEEEKNEKKEGEDG